MLLAIDVGNSNVVFALMEGEEVRHQWRISTDQRRTVDEYMVWLSRLLELERLDRSTVDAVAIANVVPTTQFELERLCRKYFGVEALTAGAPGVDYGIALNVQNPQEVGADRAVNAVAAHARFPGDLIVVDFGTATTFDIVGAAGTYEGGVIAPGINLSMDALFTAAAKLPRIGVEPPTGNAVVGKNTVQAMRSGVFWGYLGLIEGLIARIKQEVGRPMTVVATGGLAGLFTQHTAAIDVIDPDLTLRGLARIHAKHSKSKHETR
jgi:type III pantothenate kinase